MMEKDIRQIEKHYSTQQMEWVAFCIFWILMSLVLVATALGLFGNGLLSNKTYTAKGNKIEYKKFMRVEKGTELLVHLNNAGENAKISLNNDYLKKVRIEQITPQPSKVELINNELIYTFSSIQKGFIVFYLIPQKMGSQQLRITIDGHQKSFDQYIYF